MSMLQLDFRLPEFGNLVRATVEYRWISRMVLHMGRQYQYCLRISHRIS